MPKLEKNQPPTEALSRLQETAETIKLQAWQMKIYSALKLQGSAMKVVSANLTDLTINLKGTTVTPHTLLQFLHAQTITVAVYPVSSQVVKVTYSKLART